MAFCLVEKKNPTLEEEFDMTDGVTELQIPQNPIFLPELFAILGKKHKNYSLTSEEVADIKKIYQTFHEEGITEIFYFHVRNFGNIRAKELIIDTVFDWELQNGHGSNNAKAMKCIFDNVQDIELKSWVFTILNRGKVYYFMQFFSAPINIGSEIWGFISDFVSIFMTYFNIFKNIMAFFILHYITREIWVSMNYRLIFEN